MHCDGSGYLDRTGLSVDLMQSLTYSMSVYTRVAGSSYGSMNFQAWIDFNDNATFESSESIGGFNGYGSGASSIPGPGTNTFTVPTTARTGVHLMRVVTVYAYSGGYSDSYPSIDPCPTSYYYGETRDYTVNILLLPPCSGTPTAGTANASVATACPSTPFNLFITGYTYASGLAYQWQVSSDSVSWSNMSGATTISYTTTQSSPRYYRCILTCSSTGAADTSSIIFVNYISYCYCVPHYSMASDACSRYGLAISQFQVYGYGGTRLNDTNPCDGTGYQNLTTGSSTNRLCAQIWIDFNDDGNFAYGESVGGYNSAGGTVMFTISIPSGATLGSHRMRIVTVWDAAGYTYPGLDACTYGYNMGEARDYTAIIAIPGCLGAPAPGTLSATATNGCPSYTTTITGTGSTFGAGISYAWEVSSDSMTWSAVSGATDSFYVATVTSARYYRRKITCATSTLSDYTPGIRLDMIPAPASITGPTYVCSGSSITLSSATSGGSWSTSSASIASVVASTGLVYGVASGSVIITYTAPTTCITTASIVVNPSPSAITGITTACVGATTPLYDVTTGGTWSSANPSVATISSTGLVYGVSAGSVLISYTLPTGCSGPSPVATTTVTINPLPGAISGSTTICLGSYSALSTTSTGGIWTSTPSTIAAIDTFGRVTGISVGSATVTYTFRTTGCKTTTSVNVSPLTVPTLSSSVSPGLSVCAGTSVTYTANTTNGGSAPSFVWSVNGTIISGGSSYTYAPSNGDLVRVWFRSNANCATPDSMSTSVRMSVTPTANPAVTTSTGIGDTVCTGSSVTLTATPVDGGSGPIYRWWVNGFPVVASGSYTYTPSNGDVITTRIISNAPCRVADSANYTKILTVSNNVTPTVTLTSASGTNICAGALANFTATGTYGGYTPAYVWSVNGTYAGAGAAYSYYPSNGDVVKVHYTSSFPCVTRPSDSASATITVIPSVAPVTTISVAPGYIILP
ncbi:MAG: hypothetical protein EBZ77_07870, partial [Chitinophagia bacterium]|nr:hypothetical protein [Chitinophagia bacterium]